MHEARYIVSMVMSISAFPRRTILSESGGGVSYEQGKWRRGFLDLAVAGQSSKER